MLGKLTVLQVVKLTMMLFGKTNPNLNGVILTINIVGYYNNSKWLF